eukprot:9025406-Pyramimonas_sp.AAC.1
MMHLPISAAAGPSALLLWLPRWRARCPTNPPRCAEAMASPPNGGELSFGAVGRASSEHC